MRDLIRRLLTPRWRVVVHVATGGYVIPRPGAYFTRAGAERQVRVLRRYLPTTRMTVEDRWR